MSANSPSLQQPSGCCDFYSDIDGLSRDRRHTYLVQIKENTPAHAPAIGEFFGLDFGPFVTLAFNAAKSSTRHTRFVVPKIDGGDTRNLANWCYVRFNDLAQCA
ncbi:MAG TPA: hypothetical protein VIM11_01425 [Tepidisphaeraceae bacterium]|jgi:hypothetical protein